MSPLMCNIMFKGPLHFFLILTIISDEITKCAACRSLQTFPRSIVTDLTILKHSKQIIKLKENRGVKRCYPLFYNSVEMFLKAKKCQIFIIFINFRL